MKACPPGVICVESTVLVLVVFVVIALTYYTYSEFAKANSQPIIIEHEGVQNIPEVSIPVMFETLVGYMTLSEY